MSRLQSAAGHVRRDWSFDQWPLRRKLAAAVVLPMVLAFVFGGLRVQSDFASAQQLTAAADTVNVIRPVIDYNLAVQRLAAADSVGGGTLTLATARYKSAAADLSAAMKRSNVPDAVRAKATSALLLGEAVRSAKAQTGFSDVVIEKSGNIATVMSEVVSDLGLTDDPASAQLVLALQDTITAQRALTGQQINLANTDDAAAELRAIGEVGAETSALTRLQTELPTFSSPIRQVLNDNTRRAGVLEGTPTKDDLAGLAPVFQSSNATYTTLLDGQLSSLASTLVDRANANRSGAVFAALLVTAALLAAVLIVIASIRLLLSTIRVVREGALDVAQNRLPAAVAKIRDGEEAAPFEPIPVTTTEEMGQLARAVDDLHTQALTLAGEQARLRVQVGHMFETLSRRSTSLIDQQLTLIERLESDEEDPKRLQSLFRLDHLAARMRRNSDSLLVLAGTSTRRAVTGSVSVADAVRAAVSEVENYERIDIGDTANDHVLGAVGSDLIHLLAEIVDNALAYSPPTTRVAIRGARTPDGGLLVEVADRGLGMPPKDLAALNDQLAHGGDITADTARRMGLYVVGSLAKRHGIAVRLRRNGDELQGVTVSIHLPAGLLADSATIRPDRGRSARAASTTSPALDGDGKPTVTPSVVGGSTKSGLPTRVRGASGATPIPDAAKKVVPPRIPGADSLPSVNASVAPAKPVIETSSPSGDVAPSSDGPFAPNGKAAETLNGHTAAPLNGQAAEPLNGVFAPEPKDAAPEPKDGSSEADGAAATTGDPTVAPRSASGLPVRKPRASRITEYREFGSAPAEKGDAASIGADGADGAVSDSLADDADVQQPVTNAKATRLPSWLPGRAKAAAEAARLEAEANEPRQMPSNLSAWLDHRAKLVEA
ncbi:MAG TPA: ATP-binding protein, partial [Pedococcus sp.]|nr:ATP-binding protein [Pedococcus sp.]